MVRADLVALISKIASNTLYTFSILKSTPPDSAFKMDFSAIVDIFRYYAVSNAIINILKPVG